MSVLTSVTRLFGHKDSGVRVIDTEQVTLVCGRCNHSDNFERKRICGQTAIVCSRCEGGLME